MISAIFGPSGSERRLYTLIALTVLLMPVGCGLAWLATPGASIVDVLYIGCLGSGVAVWASVMCFGFIKIVAQGLKGEAQATPAVETAAVETTEAATV